jgi:aryl-alcohol dehydrogenase-like predicted oxidoreductase
MKRTKIGQTGIDASVVALGAWAMGGWMWGGTDEKDSLEAIHAAFDHGVDFIDTAPIYGFGVSEQIVGKAIEGRRDHVVIATKVGMVCRPDVGDFMFNSTAHRVHDNGHIPVTIYNGPESIRHEVEMSLRRLGTDYIDVLQTHWQESTTPISDTMETLMRLKEEGKIRGIGACNADVNQLSQYLDGGQLDVDQEKYSMLDRDLEKEQLGFCEKNNVSVWPYSPLANGLLTGKIGPEREFNPGDLRAGNPRFSVENRKTVKAMLDEFSPIAEEHTCTTAQLVTAWTLAQTGVTHVLCGMRTPEQARDNAGAGSVELKSEEVSQITSILDRYAGQLA